MLQSPHLAAVLSGLTDVTPSTFSRPSAPSRLAAFINDRQSSSPSSLIRITIDAPQKYDVARGGYYDYASTTFEIPSAHGPALRSAIEDAKNAIGTQLEKPMPYLREDALTRAANAVGKLFAGICKVIPKADIDYNYSN